MNLSKYSGLVKTVVILLASLIVASCATTKHENKPNVYSVYVTNSKKFTLLPPSAIGNNIDSLQLFTGSYGKNNFAVQAYVQADETGIFIQLLNDFGTGMGNLYYTAETITFDSAVFPKTLKPEYIVADFQYAFYKPEELIQRFNQAKLTFTVQAAADGTEKRSISNGNTIIEEITKKTGKTVIINSLRGYTYELAEAPND